MRILLALGLLPMLGCLALSTSQPDAGAAATTTGDGGVAVEGGDGSAGGGTGCGTDPQTGVTLCLGTSACPGATIDSSAFPGCGFRQGGTSLLDLECVCSGGQLCPIGVPTTCDAVAQLLTQQQSALQVCQQVSTGSCQALGGSGSSSGSGSGSSSGSTLSGACQACLSSCGMTPACFSTCGC
jgi:hypothetical protein